MKNRINNMKNRIVQFLLDRKFYLLLILIIVVVSVWAKVKINQIEKEHAKVKSELIEKYEITIDNLNIENIEMTMKVFTWAIRSEMLRDNIEQVNQFFLSFVKEPSIVNLKIVDPESAEILISTDKKEEGMIYSDNILLKVDDITLIKDSASIRVGNPVMGLNRKLGIFVAEVKPEAVSFDKTND